MYRHVHYKLFTRSVNLKINIQSNEHHYNILLCRRRLVCLRLGSTFIYRYKHRYLKAVYCFVLSAEHQSWVFPPRPDLRQPESLTRVHSVNLSPSLPQCNRPQMQKTVDYPQNGQVTFVHVGKSYPADSSSISERSQLGKNIGPFSHGGLSAAPSGLNDS